MKKFMIASFLSLLSVTGINAVATNDLSPVSEEILASEFETQAIRQVTYRSAIVRPRSFSQTYSFAIPHGVRADEIQVRGVSGTVIVERAVVTFGNGNSRLLRSLVGSYGEGGQLGVRQRSAMFNNVRNVEEVLITVRSSGYRRSVDSFRVVMGLNREDHGDDWDDNWDDAGIRIIGATYGRNVGAMRNNALDEMADACNGRQSCSFLIDFNKLGGDPAPGQVKDFSYSFTCDGQVRAASALVAAEAHLKTVRLTCQH